MGIQFTFSSAETKGLISRLYSCCEISPNLDHSPKVTDLADGLLPIVTISSVTTASYARSYLPQ